MWCCAFGALYLDFILLNAPRSDQWLGFSAFLLFNAGTLWMVFRNKKNHDEYRRLHPPVHGEAEKGS